MGAATARLGTRPEIANWRQCCKNSDSGTIPAESSLKPAQQDPSCIINPRHLKWRHYAPEVILLCVRWCCRYQLSYCDVEEIMRERGLEMDHSIVFRWVQRYAPEIDKRI